MILFLCTSNWVICIYVLKNFKWPALLRWVHFIRLESVKHTFDDKKYFKIVDKNKNGSKLQQLCFNDRLNKSILAPDSISGVSDVGEAHFDNMSGRAKSQVFLITPPQNSKKKKGVVPIYKPPEILDLNVECMEYFQYRCLNLGFHLV